MRINYRWLLPLVAILCAVALGGFLLHRRQVRRTANRELRQAGTALANGKSRQAIGHLSRYLRFRPTDIEARINLGQLLFEEEKYPESYYQMGEVLRRDPQNRSAREKLIRVAIALSRFNDAMEELAKLPSDEAELCAYKAVCLNALEKPNEAIDALEVAVELEPASVPYTSALAELLVRESRGSEARAVMDQLVQRNFDDPNAYLARGRWLLTNESQLSGTAKLESAWADAMSAIKLAPKSVAAVLFASGVALETGQTEQLTDLTLATLEANPKVASLYQAASELVLAGGNRAEAVGLLERGTKASSQPEILLPRLTQFYLEDDRFDDADECLKQLRQTAYPKPGVRLVEATILAEKGKNEDAISLLQQSLDAFRPFPELDRNAQFLLGRCFGKIGLDDKQLLALERASELDPEWIPARAELALIYTKLGRVADAIREYERVARAPNAPAKAIAGYAELLMQQSESESVGNRVDQLLERLGSIESAALETGLLRTQILYSAGDVDAARSQIRETLESYPESLPGWRASILLEISSGNWKQAKTQLELSQDSLGDRPELRLLEARVVMGDSPDDVATDSLVPLAQVNDAWSAEQNGLLLQNFAEIFFSLDRFAESRRCVDEFMALPESDANVRLLLLLFDLEYRGKDENRLAEIVEQLKSAEGDGGTMWKIGEAMRLSLVAEDAKDPKLTKALALLTEAELDRPDLGRIQRLKGQVQLKLGQRRTGLESMLTAVQRGDRDVEFVSGVVRQLIESERFVDADRLIRELQSSNESISSDLIRAASQVSVQLSNFDRAVQIARDLAEQSGELDDQIWLAQVLGISGDFTEAVDTLKDAVKKAPSDSTARISLVQMLAASGDIAAAKKAMDEAAKALAELGDSFDVGQGYEVLGDWRLANDFYEDAFESAEPNERSSVMQRLASVRSKMGDRSGAQEVLEQMLEDPDTTETEKQGFRRQLALFIAAGEETDSLAKALQVLGQNIGSENETEDRRARAVLLASYGDTKQKQEAVEIVQALIANDNRSIPDHLLLARLHAQAKNWKAFEPTIRKLMSLGGADRPECVRLYATALIDQGDFDSALVWLDQLRSLGFDETEVDTLQTRLLMDAARYEPLERFLESRAEYSDRLFWAANTAEAVADSLAKLDDSADVAFRFLKLADGFYREWSVTNRNPNQLLGFFARQGRMNELLKVEVDPEDLAKLAQSAIVANRMDSEQMEMMIARLKEVELTDSIQLVIADAYAWLGDWENAVDVYEAVLNNSPGNPSANNNMAFVLAMTDNDQVARAEKAINAALEALPFSSVVRDTRGLVLLKQGQLDDAESEFRQALAIKFEVGTLLHLAVVQKELGSIEEAKESLARLQKAVTTERIFHPLDLQLYRQLVAELAPASAS